MVKVISIDDLEVGKKYIVTKASVCGSFQVGDHLSVLPDGDILCKEAGGWLEAEAIAEASVGVELTLDYNSLVQKRTKLLAEVEKLNIIINDPYFD